MWWAGCWLETTSATRVTRIHRVRHTSHLTYPDSNDLHSHFCACLQAFDRVGQEAVERMGHVVGRMMEVSPPWVLQRLRDTGAAFAIIGRDQLVTGGCRAVGWRVPAASPMHGGLRDTGAAFAILGRDQRVTGGCRAVLWMSDCNSAPFMHTASGT